jgi:aminodeoxyfutalosine synthase
MLADAVRRRQHGARTTYVRVATLSLGGAAEWSVPLSAGEIRLAGAPESLTEALDAVTRAREAAGARALSAFSWRDVERLAGGEGGSVATVLAQLRGGGLDAIAELALDTMPDGAAAVESLLAAGFTGLTLGIQASGSDRVALWQQIAGVQDRLGGIQALNPLPADLRPFRPTTGYDDVKMVAAARLAAPSVPSIQVDWQRYGPKLAQVALTFGADDVWGVSASDEAPEGRRRAPVEEIRRNIEAAGLDPRERDGRFAIPS